MHSQPRHGTRRDRRRFLAGALAAAALSVSSLPLRAEASLTRVLPFDDGPNDPSFAAFRKRLLAALKRRDKKFLRAHVAPDVVVSWGLLTGPKHFFEALEEPIAWDIFISMLERGGGFSNYVNDDGTRAHEFVAPYLAAAELGPEWDNVETPGIVAGQNVRVRARPDREARVVGKLTYDVVQAEDGYDGWVKVRMPNGRRGYVHADFILVRHNETPQIRFRKSAGKWVLSDFLVGH